MRYFLTTILSLIIYCVSFGQTDTALSQRATTMMKMTEQSDFDKILDYTYPKLFTIVPRGQMLELLKETMDNEDFLATLDSVRIEKIHPVFSVGDGRYAIINHSQLMMMKFKEPMDTSDKEEFDSFMSVMEEKFGKGNVRFDVPRNTVRIFMHSVMVAIKDSFAKDWCFVNFDSDNENIGKMLFSDEVLGKLKEYK